MKLFFGFTLNLYSSLISVLVCFAILTAKPAHSQRQKVDIERLIAFGKIASDLRYFSPTDLIDSMAINNGWENIFYNGVRMVLNCNNERDFVDSLVKIFKPIEPSLTIVYKGIEICKAPNVEPTEMIVSKQSNGLQLNSGRSPAFKSSRLNRRSLATDFDMNYFNLMNISIPLDKKGKSFEFKVFYSIAEDRLIKSFSHFVNLNNYNLHSSDSIFTVKGNLPEDIKTFTVKLGISNFANPINIKVDDHILLDNEWYPLNTLNNDLEQEFRNSLILNVFDNDEKLFDEFNQIGDTLNVQLNKNISVSFPLAVYADKANTFPLSSTSSKSYPYNKGIISNNYDNSNLLDDQNVKIANIIMIWNVFRLSYVYNPFSDNIAEENFLKEILQYIFKNPTQKNFDFAIRKMLHTYKDAHIFYSNEKFKDDLTNSVPLTLIHLKDGYYIKRIHCDSLKSTLNVGDKLLKIDGKKIDKIWESQKYFATGSNENLINRAGVFGLLYGKKDSKTDLTFLDIKNKHKKTISARRTFSHKEMYLYTSFLDRSDNRMLNDSTYYFNLSQNAITDTLLNFINDTTKHIIFDIRGYLTIDSEEKNLINKLIRDTIVQKNMFGYHILSPIKRKFVNPPYMYVPENNRAKAKFYFLTSHSTQSAPETFLDKIKYWKIGTLIGTNTAGANGNINFLMLPGGIIITFSGIKVINSDGTNHHLIGIPPDIFVDYVLDDVVNHRDPYIEKALELITSNKSNE